MALSRIHWTDARWERRILEVLGVTRSQFDALTQAEAFDQLERARLLLQPQERGDAWPHLQRMALDVQRGRPVAAEEESDDEEEGRVSELAVDALAARLDEVTSLARARAGDLLEIRRLSERLMAQLQQSVAPAATIAQRSKADAQDLVLAVGEVRTEFLAWQARVSASHAAEVAEMQRRAVKAILRRADGDAGRAAGEYADLLGALRVRVLHYADASAAERNHFRVIDRAGGAPDAPALVSGSALLHEGIHYRCHPRFEDDRT